MKKIYYCIIEEIEVEENMSDEEIDNILAQKADGKSYMWAEDEDTLMDYKYDH